MGLASQANVIARIGGLAGLYGIELAPLHAALGTLAPELARVALVSVPITFDRLAVATRVPRDRLDGIVDTDQLVRVDQLAGAVESLELELEAGGGQLARTLRIGGGRDLAADLNQLASFGVGGHTLAALRDAAAELGAPAGIGDRAELRVQAWELQFRHSNATDSERARTRERLLAVARKLSATSPQCNLVAGIHEMMAKDRDSHATLLVAPDDSLPRLAVRWDRVRWESAIRIALGFRPGSDVGKQLGELSGAFDAEEAHAIELVLGPEEPPAMRVTVACIA